MTYPDVYPEIYPGARVSSRARAKKPMIWYTLDANLKRDRVIEDFESFIWTERYSGFGDFQIVIKSTYSNRSLLSPGTRLTKEGSTYFMIIDTIDDATDQNGERNLSITGKSFENILNDRVAMPALGNLAETPAWIMSGVPGDIIRQMFHEICVFGNLSALDTIPFFVEGTLLPPGNIPEPDDVVTISAPPDTLYNTIKKIADAYGLGFRFVKNGDHGEIYFEVYTGSDRTSGQTEVPAVVFDPQLDNLSQVRLLTSSAVIKTVAYVFSANGAVEVFAPTAEPTDSGAERRVLFVNSSNTADAGPELNAALANEGLIALGAQRPVYAFDGQLPPGVSYIYGIDYNLGDLVEERTEAGFGTLMVVTEQIFVSDKEGERSYPTLSINQAVVPGSWAGYGTDRWEDVPDTVLWTDL